MSRPISRLASRALAYLALTAAVYQLTGIVIAAFSAEVFARNVVPEGIVFVIEAAGYLAQLAVGLGLSAVVVNHFDDGYDEDRVRACLYACDGQDTERVRAALRACAGIPTAQLRAPDALDDAPRWVGPLPYELGASRAHISPTQKESL